MQKQNNTLVARFWKILDILIAPPPVITDIQKKRQARLLSTLLLIIILLGSVSGIIQLLIVPGFLGTFVAIAAAVIALFIAYAFTRTKYYLVAATITALTPSMASYAALLTNPKDQSAFVFLLISVLLSSILLDQWFTIGFAVLNLVGLLILPMLQPAWAYSVVAGKISFHIIIPALIVIAMRHRDLVEHDRQKELVESELKFRSIFDNSVDAIGVSKSGIHIMANPAYVRMFGCDNADQFVGKSIIDLIAPSHRAQILDYVQRRPTADDIPGNYETRGLRCDGTEFDMEVHVSTYESGGELFTVPILRNITARKQAEKELRQFKITLDRTSDCVFMFEPESLKFFYVNRGAIDQLGYTEIELLQMHPYDIKPEFPEPQFRSLIAPLFDGIRSEILFETVHRHNDGHYIPVEVFLQYIAPIGEKGRFVAIVRDITQRKQTEDALHKSEALYRQAIEVAGAVPYLQSYMNAITDIHYDFIGEGIRQITGYGPEEFNLQLFDSLVEESILQGDLTQYSWEEAIRRVRTGEYPIWKCEHRLRARDGSIRWVFEAAVELYDQAGVSHGSIGMFQDITERKQIQQELEENRRRLAFLLDKSPSVIYSSKATGDFGATFIATNVASQLGYHPEDFTGNPNFWFEHIHPDDISRVLAELHKLYEQGIHAHEYRFQHKNGHYLWMQDEMTLIRSDSGEPLEIIGAWINITERKQAEEALRKSEELYRQAIEVAGAVPYHQTYSENSTHVDYDFIGEGIREITGYGPDEFNEAIWDSLVQERFLLEDLTAYSFNDAIEYVRSGKHPVWKCEHHIRARGGKIHWVFEAAVELRDENGISHGSIGMFQDITKRKLAEQALRESEERFRVLFEDSPISIWEEDFSSVKKYLEDLQQKGVTDFHSYFSSHPQELIVCANLVRVLNVNKVALETYRANNKEDLLNNFNQLLNLKTFQQELIAITEGKTKYYWEGADHTVTGETIDVSLNWVVAPGYEGSFSKVIVSVIDITERKLAEREREKLIQELEAKNVELERFTYTVSHDLKSPLVTINGFLGYLEQDALAGNLDRLKKDTLRIQEAVNKMYRLLNELLELSRIGRVVNSPVQVQFRELVQEAMDVVRGQINASGVVIRVQPHLPVVYVDKPRIIEALQNLLDNAMKYMGDQPQPQIEIGQRSEQNGQPVLYIRDNGMGVAPEYHERIFGLFNKLDARSEGTGVGLALVKRIIEIHGGRIWVESELGQGATFYLTLPKVAQIN